MQKLFGKKLSNDDLVRKWRSSIRTQERQLDKQIRGIEVEENKCIKSLREVAKKGNQPACKSLAKEIFRARKAKDRIYTSKAQLNSVVMQLQQQLAQLKIAGSLQKSTEVMKLVNNLVKLPQISAEMQELQQELMKAGIIEEMMEDAMDSVNNDEDLEEEADKEADKILQEVTKGILGQAGSVGKDLQPQEETEAAKTEIDDFKDRLEALRSQE